jgi:pantothenate kinase
VVVNDARRVQPVSRLDDLVQCVRRLQTGRDRVLVGVVGEPGSGKSTVARAVASRLGGRAVVLPMDGFHLANRELARLGRSARKGAPDTFDVAGYLNLLRRSRTPTEEVVYAPDYLREFEEAVAGAIAVPADVSVVLTEGNYLLSRTGSWSQVAPLLDEVWYVDSDPVRRTERLVARHVEFGKDATDARLWAEGSDEINAAVVRASRAYADRVVDGDRLDLPVRGSAAR